MDPASLAVGVAGFAFQFYIAAEAGYNIITAAKATSENASRLQTQMGFEQIKFELWASVVGLADAETKFEELLRSDRNMYHLIMQASCHVCNTVTLFNELTTMYVIQKAELTRMTGMFSKRKREDGYDAETGNQVVTILNLFNEESRNQFEDILRTYQKRLSYMDTFLWAIKDNARFQILIEQMQQMNNGLHSSLPRTIQFLHRRKLIAAQPNDLLALRGIESTVAMTGQNTDYYQAAVLKRRALEQTKQEIDFLEGRKTVDTAALLKTVEVASLSLQPAEPNTARVLRLRKDLVQTKVLIEYEPLPATGESDCERTMRLQRLANLVDLLRITPKPGKCRILDYEDVVRHDTESDERYDLVLVYQPESHQYLNCDFRHCTSFSVQRDRTQFLKALH